MTRRRTEHEKWHDAFVALWAITALVWAYLLVLIVDSRHEDPAPVSPSAAVADPRTQAAQLVSRGNARTAPPPPSVTVQATTTPTVAASQGKSTGDGGGRWPWDALAACESSGNPRAVSVDGTYRGLYQFDRPTWRSVGGTGDPAAAPATEQLHRAKLLHAARGFQPWPQCAARLGLL